jgi:hypothetical protein
MRSIYVSIDVYWCGSAWLTEVILMDSVANDYSRCYPSHLGVPPVQSSLSWYHCAWWYLEQPVIIHLFIYKPMYINVHQCTFFVVSRPHSCDVSCSFFDATIRRIGTWGMAQKNPGGIAGSLPESTPSVDPATRDMSLRFSGRSASFHGYVQYYD